MFHQLQPHPGLGRQDGVEGIASFVLCTCQEHKSCLISFKTGAQWHFILKLQTNIWNYWSNFSSSGAWRIVANQFKWSPEEMSTMMARETVPWEGMQSWGLFFSSQWGFWPSCCCCAWIYQAKVMSKGKFSASSAWWEVVSSGFGHCNCSLEAWLLCHALYEAALDSGADTEAAEFCTKHKWAQVSFSIRRALPWKQGCMQ